MNSLKIENFKAHKNLLIEPKNRNLLLYGDNGAGKSSIYDAIKICFFKHKIEPTKTDEQTIQEFEEIKKTFWFKYNNKITKQPFTIKINGVDYTKFDSSSYCVHMLNIENLCKNEYIRLDVLLKRNYIFDNISEFLKNNYKEIQKNINTEVEKYFKESFQIDIDAEDEYKIRMKDDKRGIDFIKENLSLYFNEAKINLVYLLLFFECVKLYPKKEKNILVLDDFITSLDIANRTSIIKYIFDNFRNFQILIFTHNVYFYNLITYMINEYYKSDKKLNNSKWSFTNLYEIENDHFIYEKGSNSFEELKKEYDAGKFVPDEFGNKLRQKFEILLHEISKNLIVGSVEENKNIISNIEDGKIIVLYEKIIDEIKKLINDKKLIDIPKSNLESIINNSTLDGFKDIQKIVKELKLYQKIILHPMSHGMEGQSPYTMNEIRHSMDLLGKLDKEMKKFIDKKIDGA